MIPPTLIKLQDHKILYYPLMVDRRVGLQSKPTKLVGEGESGQDKNCRNVGQLWHDAANLIVDPGTRLSNIMSHVVV